MAAGTRGRPKPFWNDEKPADWTHDQIQTLLTDSPWSKRASVSYYGGQNGPLGTLRPNNNNRRNSNPRQRHDADHRWRILGALGSDRTVGIRNTDPRGDESGTESGLADNYILNMVGDIPTIGATDDDPPLGNPRLRCGRRIPSWNIRAIR